MNTKFTTEYKLILENSRKEAIRHQSSEIEPLHLLLALADESSTRTFSLMKGLTTDSHINMLREELDKNSFISTINYSPNDLSPNAHTERVIKLSALEARMLGSENVDAEHLLLALFHNAEIINMDFIQKFLKAGINYEGIYNQLKNITETPFAGAGFTDDDIDDDIMAHDCQSKKETTKMSSLFKLLFTCVLVLQILTYQCMFQAHFLLS